MAEENAWRFVVAKAKDGDDKGMVVEACSGKCETCPGDEDSLPLKCRLNDEMEIIRCPRKSGD